MGRPRRRPTVLRRNRWARSTARGVVARPSSSVGTPRRPWVQGRGRDDTLGAAPPPRGCVLRPPGLVPAAGGPDLAVGREPGTVHRAAMFLENGPATSGRAAGHRIVAPD